MFNRSTLAIAIAAILLPTATHAENLSGDNFNDLIVTGKTTIPHRFNNFGSLSNGDGLTPSVLTNDGNFGNQGNLLNQSQATLNNKGTLDNQGTLFNMGTVDGRGEIVNAPGANIFNLFGATFNINQLSNSGNISNSGGMTVNALDITGNGSVQNNGTLTTNGQSQNTSTNFFGINNSGLWTNNGVLQNQGFLNNMGAIDGRGSVVNAAGAFMLNQVGATFNQDKLNNSGNIYNTGGLTVTALNNTGNGQLENFASLTTDGHSQNSASANIYSFGLWTNNGVLQNQGFLNNMGAIDGRGSVVNAAGAFILNQVGATFNQDKLGNGGNVVNFGGMTVTALNNTGNGQLQNFGDLTTNGRSQNTGSASINNSGLWVNNGVFTVANGAVNNNGVWQNTGAVVLGGNSPSGATIQGTGFYLQTAGSTTLIGGAVMNQQSIDIQGGTLGGNGAISTQNGLTLENGSVLQAGEQGQAGNLTVVNGNATLSGATLDFALGGAGYGQSSQLNLIFGGIAFNNTPNPAFGNTIQFDLINGYAPQTGDSINFLNANGISGADSLNYNINTGQANSGNYLFDINNSGSGMTLQFLNAGFNNGLSGPLNNMIPLPPGDNTLVAQGAFTNAAGNTLDNQNNFQLTQGSTLSGGGVFIQDGGNLKVNGVMTQAAVNITNQGILSGTGVINVGNGAVTVFEGGVVKPGSPGGDLTIQGNMELQHGAQLAIGFYDNTFNALHVSQTMSFDTGSFIDFNYLGTGSDMWLAGQSFTFLTAGALNLDWQDLLNLSMFTGFYGLTENLSETGNNLIVTFECSNPNNCNGGPALPEPATIALLMAGLLSVRGRRGIAIAR